MADTKNSSTGPALLTEPPTIDIPDDAEINEHGWAAFPIATAAGAVEVSTYTRDATCIGTPKALIAAGIINADWIVEDRKSWCVSFDETGPHVRIGGRGRPKGAYVGIDSYCCDADEYRVRFALTRENQKALARLRRAGEQRHQECYDAVRHADADSLVARRSALVCHVEGNVIYWPGRGSVAAVSPGS